MSKNDKDTNIQELKDLLLNFREKREWGKFHNPKDLAEAIVVESSELLELFLWMGKEEIIEKIKNDNTYKTEVEDELADIVSYCINFANSTNIDITSAVKNKVSKNNNKYPVNKSKGIATKYDKL